MPCDICGHTVQNLGTIDFKTFWCPRCGTIKTIKGDYTEHEAPSIIKRLRDPNMHLAEVRKELVWANIIPKNPEAQ
jgi:uncharacterized C2H2 Zn-finger protein